VTAMQYRRTAMHFIGVMVLIGVSCLTTLSTHCSVQGPAANPLVTRGPVFAVKARRPEWFTSDQEQDRLIEFCLEYGVNRLIIPIWWTQNPLPDQDTSPQPFHNVVRLITKAAKHGISTEAFERIAATTLSTHPLPTQANLKSIIAFNKTLPRQTRLVGLHYEIDPHLLSQQESSRRRHLMRLCLDWLTAARVEIQRSIPTMRLAADIPGWYDTPTANDEGYVVDYDGQRKNFHEHIQDITDHVVVMCRPRQSETGSPIS